MIGHDGSLTTRKKGWGLLLLLIVIGNDGAMEKEPR